MTPSFKELVRDLRNGVGLDDAFDEYCQKSLLVPIADQMVEGGPSDPMHRSACICAYGAVLERLAENAKQDDSDEGLYEKFLDDCRKFNVVWRPMRDGERWSPRELYMQMPQADKDKALELFGVTAIAKVIAQ